MRNYTNRSVSDGHTHAGLGTKTACGRPVGKIARFEAPVTCAPCLAVMAWEIQQQLWQVVELPEPVAANLGTAVATLRLTLSESLECYRCKRTRPVSALEPTTEGLAKCTPGADGYDDCMRLWTAL